MLKRSKWINTFAAAALTTGFSLMTTLSTTSSIANTTGFQILSAIGGGILFPGRLIAVQAQQKSEDLSIATALVSVCTSLGQTFGVAIGDAVFQNRWDVEVQKKVTQGLIGSEFIIISRNAEQTATIIKAFPESVREVYRVVMASTISAIWIVVASFAGVATLACLGMSNISLEKPQESGNISLNKEIYVTLEQTDRL